MTITLAKNLVMPEAFYKTLLDSLFDAVFTVDCAGIITYWNPSCARITGYAADEMLQRHYSAVSVNDDPQPSPLQPHGMQIVLESGMPGTWKGYIQRKNGQRLPVESHIAPLHDPQGAVIGAVEVFRDISAMLSLQDAHRQLLTLSRKDPLTGMFNRAAITELLKAEVERCRRYLQPLALILVDIDLFKRFNDLYGHDVGDKVLAQLGAVLSFNLRSPDAVGRWGGEEFLIVSPGSDRSAGKQLAQRMRRLVKDISIPGINETVTASFGVAQLEKNQSRDELIYTADMAMYQAKRTGRDRVVVGCAESISPVQPPPSPPPA